MNFMKNTKSIQSLLRFPTAQLLFSCIAVFSFTAAAGPWSQESYQKLNTMCDGFSQLPVGTMPGTCMGLVMDKTTTDPNNGLSLKFPRKIVQIPNSDDFILVDMGGWAPKNGGRVFKLVKNNNQSYSLKTLFTKINLPHDVEVGPDGKIYIGEMGRIFRFDPNDLNLKAEVIIDGLPTNLTEANMHPLNSFSFGKGRYENDLFVNVGSPTDGCIKSAPGFCEDAEKGTGGLPAKSAIWQYKYLGQYQWSQSPVVFAKGLRNSMAQVIHESGTFIQAENGRDLKSATEPHEELNIIEAGKHYGFPYCYNFNATVADWEKSNLVNCQDNSFQKPHTLLPPRSAPLDMIYYSGKMFPEIKNHLLMTWHGYMPVGNRIVSYPTDEFGRPLLTKNQPWNYNVWHANQVNGKSKVTAVAKGGILQSAPHYEIVSDWFAKTGLRPNGSVVGITEATDGSIWIVSDYNKTVTRLGRGQNWRPANAAEAQGDQVAAKRGLTPEEITNLKTKLLNNPQNLRRWGYVSEGIIKNNCISCHGGFVSEGFNPNDRWSYFEYMLSRPGWVVPGQSAKSEMYLRMSSSKSGTPMPPKGLLSPADQLTIQRFIDQL